MIQLNEREVVLVIGCDCDPLGFVESSKKIEPRSWELTARVLKNLVACLSAIPYEQSIKVTFLVRSDSCMQETFGEYAYCAKSSYGFLDALRSKGHEIGWHPHFWRWAERWVAELKDSGFIRDCLVKGFNSLSDLFEITSVRTGWDYMSNEVMETLESLGIRADFSAIPGTKYHEASRGISSDWLGTPSRFYFPSREDYRRPAAGATPSFKVLEMPLTLTKPPQLVRWVRPTIDRYYRAARMPTPYQAMNIAKHPVFNKNGFERILTDEGLDDARYILTYFHPSDVTGRGLFSMRHLQNNVRYLLTRCKHKKDRLTVMTATEAANKFLESASR